MRYTVITVVALGLMVPVIFLTACGSEQKDYEFTRVDIPDEPGDLVDDTYRASYDYLDNHGWAAYMVMEVANGNIVNVEFDYINAAGELKSQDVAYQQRMSNIVGIGPQEFLPEIAARIINAQGADIDVVSGATSSVKWAQTLAEALKQRAQAGVDQNLVLGMDETYTAELEPDQRGWLATIEVEFADGELVSAKYDEVQRENRQVTNNKRDNEEYAQSWKGRYEEAPFNNLLEELLVELEQQLVDSGRPADVDMVTGATGIVSNFRAVAEKVLAKRQPAPEPW